MKKQDIRAGELYAVAAPTEGEEDRGYGDVPWLVKATAVEVGIARSGSERLDGVRLRLEEPWRMRRPVGIAGAGSITFEPGQEWVGATVHVERLWSAGADDEAICAKRVERYERHDRVFATMERLGMPVTDKWRGKVHWSAAGVKIDGEAFDRWLRRIDPMSVAADAIELFVGSLDPMIVELPADVVELATATALEEVRQGLAVSDADIEP